MYIFYHFNTFQHIGFECLIYYWHFVDIVWLLLFGVLFPFNWLARDCHSDDSGCHDPDYHVWKQERDIRNRNRTRILVVMILLTKLVKLIVNKKMHLKLINSKNIYFEQHPFHLVNPSPWPLYVSFALLTSTLSFLIYFNFFKNGNLLIITSFIILTFFLMRWFVDIVIEATYEGNHTEKVRKGLRLGMLLFIVSEIMFFFSFFWAFLHCSLAPSIDIGSVWPPRFIITLDAWSLPLVNTIILLSSGITITWAHKAIIFNNRKTLTIGVLLTIFYGFIFSLIQYYEYIEAPFSINDGIYGSLFFMLTGFHGFHVFIGTIFLIICIFRHIFYHFNAFQHIGFECAIYYWHFVDIVWLFLFILVYIWGI